MRQETRQSLKVQNQERDGERCAPSEPWDVRRASATSSQVWVTTTVRYSLRRRRQGARRTWAINTTLKSNREMRTSLKIDRQNGNVPKCCRARII